MTDSSCKQQKSLRILMVAACPFPWSRGTPIRIQRLAEALVEEGHSVDVVTYHLGESADKLPFRVHRTAKVFYYKRVSAGPSLTKLFVLDPMLIFRLLKVGKSDCYDIVHAHHIEAVMAAVAARALGLRLPIVYDAHTLVGSELFDYGPPFGRGIKRLLGDFLDHSLARKADSVIAVTDSIKSAFLQRGTRLDDEVYVISNGIEDDFIKRATEARLALTTSVSEKNKTKGRELAPLFMFAGNTASYQRIDLMLEAFALVLKRIPDARLQILTNEPFTKYHSLVESTGISDNLSVSGIGLDELPKILVKADVLINPRTRCAGIPQKLLNYMAAGRPVVSFAGSAKIITDQVNGLIVENGNTKLFADAMIELVENRKLGEALSEAALKLILERYSWRSTAKQVQSVYFDTLKKYEEQ